MTRLKYKRVLLKISGEGLSSPATHGLTGDGLHAVANQIAELVEMNVEPAIVVGAGNFIRGAAMYRESRISRVTADQMGMLATVINSIALQDVLESKGVSARVLSAIG